MIEYSEGDRVLWNEPHGPLWSGEVVETFRCDHGAVITHYSVQLDGDDGRVIDATESELAPFTVAPVVPADRADVEDGCHEWARGMGASA
jgi:hypothetical protein